jgi:Polyribonucleotide nucleotidyltransferase (polynucleotide phosphorylase)
VSSNSAAGRLPGGFTKRDGTASDEEILTSRLVDRALRPLFPSYYHAEVYVQVMLLPPMVLNSRISWLFG